jgi:hypothetical protein
MDAKIISKILRDFFRHDKVTLPKADILTFACDNDRYINYEGRMYSPLVNTIEDKLLRKGLTSISITRIASTLKGELAHGRVFSFEGEFSRAMIFKRLKGLIRSRNIYPFSWMEVKIWEKILTNCGAKAVIAILPSRELCYVCRQRGIWVCDVQHGVIGNEHYWYGADFRASDPIKWLPNSFLVWDEGSHQVINRWAKGKDVDVEIIGNPWVDRFRYISESDELVANLRLKYKIGNNEKKTVLLSLSWGVHGLENKFIHPALEKFIQDTVHIYNWKIRLHPNQVKGFASNEGREFVKYYDENWRSYGVEWEETTSMPLPLLLLNTDYHVTWVSSVCMEASYFGVPTLVLCPKLLPGGDFESYYEYLVEKGYVEKLMPTYDNIKQWFDSRLSSKLEFYCDYHDAYEETINRITGYAL